METNIAAASSFIYGLMLKMAAAVKFVSGGDKKKNI